MTPCVAYLRVSGKAQLDGDGFPRQALAAEKYAAANNLELTCVFTERGITGESYAEDRPAWLGMRVHCEAIGVTKIVIERLDRLARDLMVQETLLSQALKAGLEIISTCEPDLGSKDPTRVMIRQILGSVAQYDKAQIVAKLRGARERAKAARGKCEGQKAYGEVGGNSPNDLERAMREQEHIAFMRDWYLKTKSYNQVAAELNARGIVGRHGGRWTNHLVARIIRRSIQAETKQLRSA